MEIAEIIARVSSATQVDCDAVQGEIGRLEAERDALVLEKNKRIDAMRGLLRMLETCVKGNHRRLPRAARKVEGGDRGLKGPVTPIVPAPKSVLVNRGFGEPKIPAVSVPSKTVLVNHEEAAKLSEPGDMAYSEPNALASRIAALLEEEGSLPLLGIASRLNAMIPMVRDVLSSDRRFKQEPSREWGLRKKG